MSTQVHFRWHSRLALHLGHHRHRLDCSSRNFRVHLRRGLQEEHRGHNHQVHHWIHWRGTILVLLSLEFENLIFLKVYFPSVTICNINQVRESFFLDMKLDSKEPLSKEIIDLLYKQFYSGSLNATTEKDKDRIKNFLTSENYVRAGEWHCELLIISQLLSHNYLLSFQSLTITISPVATTSTCSRQFELLLNIFTHSGKVLQREHTSPDWRYRNPLVICSLQKSSCIIETLFRSHDS